MSGFEGFEPKDWLLLVLGGFLALFLQNIMFPVVTESIRSHRRHRRLRQINSRWKRFRELFPSLELVQSGWSPRGTFTPSSIRMRLVSDYILPRELSTIRASHEAEWKAARQTDGDQVGIAELKVYRTSDDPGDERHGDSHIIQISCQKFHYFDFLATHRRLVAGSPEEREVLKLFVPEPDSDHPVGGFPNPLSVGLSLFCEDGRFLAIGVRSRDAATGGEWQGGKKFNAVGENATPSDFSTTFEGHSESSPFVVARRGLYEEAGFSQDEAHACQLEIHSLAWASDILDHKFFGWAVTGMAQAQVRDKWEHAADRREYERIYFADVRSRPECLALWSSIVTSPETWSPEAIFCTARTLVLRGMLKPNDLLR